MSESNGPPPTVEDSPNGGFTIRYATGMGFGFYADHEEPLRRALNARHKERQAAKTEDARFYAAWLNDTADKSVYWVVRDRDDDHAVHGQFPHPSCAEADAKAFARLLNKRNRKPMGGGM